MPESSYLDDGQDERVTIFIPVPIGLLVIAPFLIWGWVLKRREDTRRNDLNAELRTRESGPDSPAKDW